MQPNTQLLSFPQIHRASGAQNKDALSQAVFSLSLEHKFNQV